MLDARPLRRLSLAAGQHPRGLRHLSAASGLVAVQGRYFVVADDEHHLALFPRAFDEQGQLFRLLSGDLPHEARARKAQKPDFEALQWLPPGERFAHGALLAWGSGSGPLRHRLLWVALGPEGEPIGPAGQADLSDLYAPLHARFADLNIEGAFGLGDRLCLLHRGNSGVAVNACIVWPWGAVAQWLWQGGPVPAPEAVQTHELGAINGVPLGFTDGAALPDGGWVFCAVAEDTNNSYADGACVGAAVGRVSADGRLVATRPLAQPWKVEGLVAEPLGAGLRLTLVTDADDPAQAAQMLVLDWV
jgi:hypothetical protein